MDALAAHRTARSSAMILAPFLNAATAEGVQALRAHRIIEDFSAYATVQVFADLSRMHECALDFICRWLLIGH